MIYVCPQCKENLDRGHCSRCGFEIQWDGRVPVFFSGTPVSQRYREIGTYYDELYGSREKVWEEVAFRGAEFTRFMADLVESQAPKRYLDVGCGEGFLLSEVASAEKFGTEISRAVIEVAGQRANAEFCQACAEELPYPDSYFDVVTSVGVTEHLLDDLAATAEIRRVLRPGGRYFAGMYVPITLWERISVKVSEFVCPRFRPHGFLHWAIKRYLKSGEREAGTNVAPNDVKQPVMNFYTPRALKRLFSDAGFQVLEIITKRNRPDVPLPGHFFRIYVLGK